MRARIVCMVPYSTKVALSVLATTSLTCGDQHTAELAKVAAAGTTTGCVATITTSLHVPAMAARSRRAKRSEIGAVAGPRCCSTSGVTEFLKNQKKKNASWRIHRMIDGQLQPLRTVTGRRDR